MTKIVSVKSLNKTFYSKGSFVNAINNVSFELDEGKTIGLIGESGSGKTTIGRTLMNLHRPDSGSMIINKTEYGGKLSKKNKKKLYQDVQMIFQDPYSSLNSQKNIYSILKEALIVKNKDKEILKNFLTQRKKVLKYYQQPIKEFYWKKYWDYRQNANKEAIKTYEKISNKLKNFEINPKKTFFENFGKFEEFYFEEKFGANAHIIEYALDFINDVKNNYLDSKKKVLKNKFDHFDEVKLNQAQNVFDELKLELKHSKEEQNAQIAFNKILEKFNNLNKHYKLEKKRTKTDVQKTLQNNIKEYKILKNKLFLSKTKKEYNNIQSLLNVKKIVIKVIKKIKNNKIIFIDFAERAKDIYYNIINKYKNKEKGIVELPNNVTSIVKKEYFFLVDKGSKETKKYINDITKLKQKSIGLKEIWKKSSEKSSEREISSINKKWKQAQIVLNQANKENQLKFLKYKKIFNKKIESLRNEFEDKANKNTQFLKVTRKKFDKKSQEIFNKIIKNKKLKYGDNFFKKSQEIKNIKYLFKENIKRNKVFDIELKRILNETKTLKYFINLKNDDFQKLNKYKKYKIKKLLIKNKILEILKDVGLNKSNIYGYPHEFSGGMRQRVGIARAIISEPKLIIADEPIAALDLSIQAQIVNLLNEISKKRKLALIFIAHDLSMIEYNCERVMIMHLGRVVEYGLAKSIFKNPIHPYTKNLIDSMPKVTEITRGFNAKKFIGDYQTQYSIINEPKYHKLANDHFVLGLNSQIQKWKIK